MTIGLKRIGLGALAAILVIGAFVATISFVNRGTMRSAVENQIRYVTGLDLAVDGDISVSLFPAGKMVFHNVRLKGDSGNLPALSVARLTANLRILPLIFHRIEISDIVLSEPRVNVIRSADGRTNWARILETLSRTLKPGTSAITPFSEILAENGVVVFTDDSHNIRETVSDVRLALAWPSISRSFGATGQFTWRKHTLDASLTLGDFLAVLSGKSSTIKSRLTGDILKAAFDGTMSHEPDIRLDGTLSMDSPALRETLNWAGLSPLAETGFGRFALKAKTLVKGATVGLSNVVIELDGNTAEGVLSYSSDRRQTIQGTLASETVDLTPYVSTTRRIQQGRNWSRQKFEMGGMRSIDLDMRLSAAAVKIGNTKLGRTAVAANLNAGNLTLSIAEAQTFGGALRGSVAIAADQETPSLRTQLQFTDIDLEPALGEMFGFRRLAGKGNLSVALDGEGESAYELARKINGTVLLTGQNGALLGVNVEQLLRRLEKRPLSGTGEFRGGRTSYATLNVAARLTSGLATSEDIRLEGPTLRMSLAGAATLADRELDLKGVASLVPASNNAAAAFELPFVVQGSWDNPIVLPDPEILLRRSRASAPLLDSVRERKTRDAVRSAIERLTGVRPTGDLVHPAQTPAAPAATSSEAPTTEQTPVEQPPAQTPPSDTPAASSAPTPQAAPTNQ